MDVICGCPSFQTLEQVSVSAKPLSGVMDVDTGVYLRTNKIRLPDLVILHAHLLCVAQCYVPLVLTSPPSREMMASLEGQGTKSCWLVLCSHSQLPHSSVIAQGL